MLKALKEIDLSVITYQPEPFAKREKPFMHCSWEHPFSIFLQMVVQTPPPPERSGFAENERDCS